ncbi:unnamed protein product [Cyprideis torosa]|uniref:Uncharacterized protein n=1 Tax=Cyprideis torosa TaxID=163714 RepID=A0A7R8WXC4_9CRUS|nr:unnamed protein product [Cyprideis torosa]CAG0908563.1 unnamed protein product [Cyprideis torosa]
MSRLVPTVCFVVAVAAGAAVAEVPRVSTDIAPVHSLVSRVMQGVAEPDLIVAPGASPHEYSLRPSEAAALQDANIVFWIGPDLTPWMVGALDTLSADATVIPLLNHDQTERLSFRENAIFEADGHDDHDAHASDDHGHSHAEGASDPHAWLSPKNAGVWLDVIATTLAETDPENAALYLSNAKEGQAELATMIAEIEGILTPAKGGMFVVFHDAYQYFENAFDLPSAGAINLSDASDPSPARIADIQAHIAEHDITCVLSEPQFDPGLVRAVSGDSGARVAVLDPLGSDLQPGASLYPMMLQNLAQSLAECFGG